MPRTPQYTSVQDVADWLRIEVNANTDPNTRMVENFIMDNEDRFDRETGHSYLPDGRQYRTDTFDVSDIYDYGRGLYVPLKHRNIKPWDQTKGDKFEIWNGVDWFEHSVTDNDRLINIEPSKGSFNIRGYIYTILRKNRFRVTYRYGGTKEIFMDEEIPRDIQKCIKLWTSVDILKTDFKMSQIPYGGEGNIDKREIIRDFEMEAKKIVWNYNEIQVVM